MALWDPAVPLPTKAAAPVLDDFTNWDLVVIEAAPGLGGIRGASTVIVEASRITNVARYGAKPVALVSTSQDCGRT